MTTRLLFTGGGGSGSEAIDRFLSDRCDVHFADADAAAIPPVIAASRRHAIPMASDPEFASSLAALCRQLSVDVLVPSVDEELPLMAAVANEAPGLSILVPRADFVAMSLDKWTSMQALDRAGITVPETTLASDPPRVGFPLIVKPRRGRGSRGVMELTDADQLAAYLVLNKQQRDDVVVQEKLSGQEFTVLVSETRDGDLGAIVPVRVDRKQRITLRAAIDWDEAVIDACQRIHQAFRPGGCYNVQLMKTLDGRCAVFEINPRVSTTLCLSLSLGVDPVAIYLGAPARVPHGERLELRRHWSNVISRPDRDDRL